MIKYPKIETLYNRDAATFKVTDELRLPEFGLVNEWLITEKVDGTNVRVHWNGLDVRFGGRTDNAQMPTFLLDHLQRTFGDELLDEVFGHGDEPCGGDTSVTLFGEGYGPKIQKGGGYRDNASFRLFDVRVGDWWLNWPDVEDVAEKLGILTVPVLARDVDLFQALNLTIGDWPSATAREDGGTGCIAEGIVARTDPLLLTRRGRRLMFKLKGKDFG